VEIKRHATPIAMAILGFGLLAVAVVLYLFMQKSAGPAAHAPAPAGPSPVSIVNGMTVVTLTPARQQRSDIRSEPLVASSHRTETTAYATIMDLQALVGLRSRHSAAQSDASTTAASVVASRAEFERNRVLYADDRNVSLKAYQAAQATYLADKAKADAAALNVRNIETAAEQQFGKTMARYGLEHQSAEFERLLARRDVLARVTLPPGTVQQAPDAIQVQPNAGARLPAYLVSPSAQSEPGVAGKSFIYRVPAPIAAGTPVVAFVPGSEQSTPGVQVPSAAVIWYAGQPWVYVQSGPGRFARRPLRQEVETDSGFFVPKGLKGGESVVTRGAQLLLSEEQRLPSAGAACKDPECD
jgi:multidrug efflux system membrane fusion protein